MEPITWGALSAVLLFVIAVSTFLLKITKDYDSKTDAKIKSVMKYHKSDTLREMELLAADNESKIALLSLEISYLKNTSVRQEHLSELKSDVKTLVARLEDMRSLLLIMKDGR